MNYGSRQDTTGFLHDAGGVVSPSNAFDACRTCATPIDIATLATPISQPTLIPTDSPFTTIRRGRQ